MKTVSFTSQKGTYGSKNFLRSHYDDSKETILSEFSSVIFVTTYLLYINRRNDHYPYLLNALLVVSIYVT